MKIEVKTYHRYINYWSSYTDEIKLNMISAIEKAATWAFANFSETYKLYALFMLDGEKLYTDYAGFRKILKVARQQGVEIHVI
jgi:hypothetical protein